MAKLDLAGYTLSELKGLQHDVARARKSCSAMGGKDEEDKRQGGPERMQTT